jgi:hypothetical protein
MNNVVIVHPAQSPRNGMSSVTPQFDPKGYIDPEFASASPVDAYTSNLELDTRNCVDHLVSEEYMNGSQHSSAWGHPTVKWISARSLTSLRTAT